MISSKWKAKSVAIKSIAILSLVFGICSVFGCKTKEKEPTPEEHTNPDELVLFDFEDGFDVSRVAPQDASFELVNTPENNYIKVKNGFSTKEPGVVLKRSKENPWDLNGYYQVKADVTNIGDEFMQVELFVGNDPDGLIRWYCSDYVDLNPKETKTITINLAWTPWVYSPQQEVLGMRGTPGKIKTDINAIDELTFCSRYAYTENEFTIDNVRAVGKLEVREPVNFFPFIDKFGQYIHKDWKGKVHSEEELKEKSNVYSKELAAHPGPADRSKYGGWTAGPKLKATGVFRTQKHNGKWWMVDPEGYLFWSSGVNCVASNSVSTGITGRENYFKEIPKRGGASDQFFGDGQWDIYSYYKGEESYYTYNFYQSNLHKKYGDQWLEKFRELAHLRLKSWGLNTIGFVSDFGATKQQKTPYTGSVWIKGTPKIESSEGFWGKFHDVFDPGFQKAVHHSMAQQKDGAGDPWCIGYFVDNELSWGQSGSLAVGVLKSPATQPAKLEFIKDLKQKYTTIEALNGVWGTTHASWDALLKNTTSPDLEKAKEDLVTFYEKIALTYFKTVKEELNIIAPNQNYLGCRFAWANNEAVLRSASKYCNILSFNKYEYSVENVGLPAGIDMPIMIGEFHFGALDRGSFHSGVKAAEDQADRGKKYQNYIQGALRNPLIVGAHWFQYLDEPMTGRGDGENYNIGLVDICDNPYEELVNKLKETNYPLYTYRNDSSK